jgi:hypothetical protein
MSLQSGVFRKSTEVISPFSVLLLIMAMCVSTTAQGSIPTTSIQFTGGRNDIMQEVNAANEKAKKRITQIGTGIGTSFPGVVVRLEFTHLGNTGWGVFADGNLSFTKHRDPPVPYDFFDDRSLHFYPKDYLNWASLCLIKGFYDNTGSVRYSISAGPSIVEYSKAVIKPNPNYDPGSIWTIFMRKYYKTQSVNVAPGLTLAGNISFLMSKSVGIELKAFANINEMKDAFGMGISIIFGDIRD